MTVAFEKSLLSSFQRSLGHLIVTEFPLARGTKARLRADGIVILGIPAEEAISHTEFLKSLHTRSISKEDEILAGHEIFVVEVKQALKRELLGQLVCAQILLKQRGISARMIALCGSEESEQIVSCASELDIAVFIKCDVNPSDNSFAKLNNIPVSFWDAKERAAS